MYRHEPFKVPQFQPIEVVHKVENPFICLPRTCRVDATTAGRQTEVTLEEHLLLGEVSDDHRATRAVIGLIVGVLPAKPAYSERVPFLGHAPSEQATMIRGRGGSNVKR